MARSKNASSITNANDLRADRIRSYIEAHYYEMISQADLAARMGIDIRRLNDAFKAQYRMTPMQYLTEVRMGVAKRLLAETNKDVVSICFEVGYVSLATFYRTFKNIVHQSPNQYRSAQKAEK